MTVLNLKSFGMMSTAGLIDGVRSWLGKSQQEPELELPVAVPSPVQTTRKALTPDQARYARILDHELDRELPSEVEREDSEMLARVRDALYADD